MEGKTNSDVSYNTKSRQRADSHRELYAPNRILFRNTAPKNHGRRQPCRGFFACLAKKSLVLECFAVLRGRFFATGAIAGRRNTGCISRQRLWLWRKRFFQNRVNPYVGPPKGAALLRYSEAFAFLASTSSATCRERRTLYFS